MTLFLDGVVILAWAVALSVLVRGQLHAWRARRGQDDILRAWTPGLGGRPWFRILLSRQVAIGRAYQAVPVDGRGLLIDEGSQLRLVACLGRGERLERVYQPGAANLRWFVTGGASSVSLHWLCIGPPDSMLLLCADIGRNPRQSKEATAAILRTLKPDEPEEAAAAHEVALDEKPAAQIVAGVFIGAVGLSVLDMAWSAHEVLAMERLALIAASLGMTGLLAYRWLIRARVAALDAVVLCGFLVVGLAAGFARGALRLDLWLADGAVPTAYRLEGHARLVPVTPGPPQVSLPQFQAYWDQFDPGTVHPLDLVHGPLGLWQLDRRRLEAALAASTRRPAGDRR